MTSNQTIGLCLLMDTTFVDICIGNTEMFITLFAIVDGNKCEFTTMNEDYLRSDNWREVDAVCVFPCKE